MANTILSRLSYRDPPENLDLSSAQKKADLFVYSFHDQLTDPILIASQLAGAGACALVHWGALRLFRARNLLVFAGGLASGAGTFDLTRRSLLFLTGEDSQYPNLWKWETKRDGMPVGMVQSAISIGIPLSAGYSFGSLFFFKDFKASWGIAGIIGIGSYLLSSGLMNPAKTDICLDSLSKRDVCP
jgi:hypothetical protein